jgi:hypothetical protein
MGFDAMLSSKSSLTFWRNVLYCMLLAGSLIILLFNPDDGGSIFFWTFGDLPLDYMLSHPRK